MHINLAVVTALAIFFHMGTALAAALLKDRTDQDKIAALDAKVDQVIAVVTAVAGALAPQNPPAPNSGGTGGASLVSGGKGNAG